MIGAGESNEGHQPTRSNGAATLQAAALGAGFGLLAVVVAVFAPLAVALQALAWALSEDKGEAIGVTLMVLALAALLGAALWGCVRALRALARRAPGARPGAARKTVLAGSVLAVAAAVAVPMNPLDEYLSFAASALVVALATAATAVVTVRGGARVRGSRMPLWIAVALLAVPIAGLVAVSPLLAEMSARGEVQADIDAYGGELAIVDSGGWRADRLSWASDGEYLDVGYVNADGDHATLRHIPAGDWGAEGTAEGHSMCPLHGYTCEETDGGSRLLVKDNGRLYSTELTLDDGSGVSIDVAPDYSKPEDEQVSPQVVGELSKFTRQATPEERERLVDAVLEVSD